jgi:hypothetical protein
VEKEKGERRAVSSSGGGGWAFPPKEEAEEGIPSTGVLKPIVISLRGGNAL